MRKLLALLLLAATLAVNADNITNQIKASLKTSLPELNIDEINPTVLPDVYEIVSGHKVFYVDSSGRYAFLGNMVDLSTKQSLTQARVEALSKVNFNQLPFSYALVRVNGTGERKLAIFTDPDCPFCQRLEQETIPKLTNVTIYYFLFPLAIHANAETDSKKIVCSETPDKTFLEWMVNGKSLPQRSECRNAANLSAIKDFGVKKIGVEATPTIILPNGKVMTGLIPADYLNQLLTEASPVLKKAIESKAL
jgi:thiol:disulfide interchange protein DsbC